jgi:hypothetical protein
MNIQRVNSELTPRVESGPSRSVDMTISEKGVSINGLQSMPAAGAPSTEAPSRTVNNPPAPGLQAPQASRPPEMQIPVTSTPELQQLLSTEEIQALQQFITSPMSATARPAMHTSGYDVRGTPVHVDEASAPGSLVDLVG